MDILRYVALLSFVLAVLGLTTMACVFALLVGVARTRRQGPCPPPSRRPRITVLIPAHNEAAGIGATLDSVKSQLESGDQMLVVADNCEDDTAAVARAHGAQVAERHDEARRGKSYALQFGVRALAAMPPDVVIVVDADCLLEAGALTWLGATCHEQQRPVQAAYLMHAQVGAHAGKKVAQFAWAVKNLLRPLGWRRLGMGCQLTGSGMAFPWSLLRDAPLANGHIAEDLQLGLDFASAGAAPVFCADAVITSVFAENALGEYAQRTRWEHGHLALILSHGKPLLGRAMLRRDRQLAALAVDLCVPPLSLLMMLAACAAVIGLLAWVLTGAQAWLMGGVPFVILAWAVVVAWLKVGRQVLPLRQAGHVLAYALAKIPLYVRFLVRRQLTWVGAVRDRR
jgi:cellulose synthase/poly-beta-1,6-N-acetylglucosamine synthase-like glycosyltransferase